MMHLLLLKVALGASIDSFWGAKVATVALTFHFGALTSILVLLENYFISSVHLMEVFYIL